MDQASEIVTAASSRVGPWMPVLVGILLLWVVYSVYTYLYPASDANYVKFLAGEADARKPITLDHWQVPSIYTGGDFTYSMWIYIDDWNYMASKYKFLFSLSPVVLGGFSPLVGVLTPMKNSLIVRAATSDVPATAIVSPSKPTGPDITKEANLQILLKQQTTTTMFESTVDQPCDVKEVAVQRWTNITIVNSGRVLDVYMDGKLTRSCMLDTVLQVPRGQLKLRLGESGGFGGRYSCIQMWNQQLTPDLIYSIYQAGPVQTQHGIFADLAKFLNINVTFTGGGSMANQPPGSAAACNSMTGSLDQAVSGIQAQLSADAAWAKNQFSGY